MSKISPYNGIFKNLDTPEKIYWFGFIVGDGCIGIYDSGYRFIMVLKDKEHVEKLAIFLGYPINRVKVRKDNCYYLEIGCKELVIDLMNLGLTPRKSHTLDGTIIPKRYNWDFIRGLWDADGNIHLWYVGNNKRLKSSITLYGNYPLLKGIKNIIGNNGCLRENKSRNGRADSLSYGGRFNTEKILNKLYYMKPYLDRKYNLYKDIVNYNGLYGFNENRIKKYKVYIKDRSYYEQECLYCGNKFIIRTDHSNKGNCGRFCSHSHSALYHWKLRKESGNYAYNAV